MKTRIISHSSLHKGCFVIKKLKNFLIDSDKGQNVIFIFITLSLLNFVFSTTAIYDENYKLLDTFENVFVFVFSIEYFLRISYSKNKIKEFFSPYTLIDLLAILPFYIGLFFPFTLNLQFLRVFRVLRVGKFFRNSPSFQLLISVFKDTRHILKTVMGGVFLFMFVVASFIHIAEPENFPTFIDGLWWSIVTMSTVGYGDLYPETFLGRVLAGFVMVGGILLFAIFTSIISVSFLKAYEKMRGG